MTRRHDARRARAHRSYTAAQVAALFQVNITTVRGWTNAGLKPLAGTYPYLFAGADVAAFVSKRNKPRQPTGPGELYCVACKAVVRPLASRAIVIPRSDTSADLRGSCPRCRRFCFQRVRLDRLNAKVGDLEVRYEDAEVPIGGNCNAPHTAPVEGAEV